MQDMMEKVVECASEVKPLFEALCDGDKERMLMIVDKISRLEYETDQIKNRIRSSLPKSLFMPVARGDILEIVAVEDGIADAAEDVAMLLSLKDLRVYDELKDLLLELVDRVISVVKRAKDAISELDVLLESSFEGPEVQKLIGIIDEVCRLEHTTDEFEKKVTKSILQNEDKFSPAELWLWLKVVAKLGDLANYSEKMVNKLRIILSK
jgi:predicted phosphate transport protein (TIGR00153 family)